MRKNVLIGLVLLAIATVYTVQQRKLNLLTARLNTLQTQSAPVQTSAPATPQRAGPVALAVRSQPVDATTVARIDSLEAAMRELLETSDFLMENGRVPLVARKMAEMVQRLGDASVPDEERLQALRLLRQGGQLNEQAATAALNWLNTSTNAGLREDILRRMEGATNSSLQNPLLQLAMNDPDADVREQAVDNLGRYITNPQVESMLWNILGSDANEAVRREAARALTRAPVTEERLAALELRTLDPNSTLDERLIALQALRRSEAQIPETMAALAQQAYASTDPIERARLFDAFDGFSDPALKVPLVYGLQDPNPEVRERAADALSGFRSDPQVLEWLRYVAESDADPEVRREALRAMGNLRL